MEPAPPDAAARMFVGETGGLKRVTTGKNDGAFESVAKFADVAGPRVGCEHAARGFAQV